MCAKKIHKQKYFAMVMVNKKYPFFKLLAKKPSEQSDEEKKVAKDLDLENFGWSSKFYKKEPEKITVTGLFMGFWKMADRKENSLRSWALHIGQETNEAVSKQALDNRLSWSALELVKMVLKYALSLKLSDYFTKEKKDTGNQKNYGKFNNILIQDSTVQKLPPELWEIFKSSYSHGKKAASLRIQAIYNFTTETWVDFDIGAYTDNDQSKAMMITQVAQKDDLILRDLGYFTLESLGHLIENQWVVTKWAKTTNLYEVQSKQQINLLSLFKYKTQIDQLVHVGSKHRLPMRLVAQKLPKPMADQRIEAAKNDRHSKANHSDEYYELLKWEIYLTNVDAQVLTIKEIVKIYGLRWYIEILFKAWKSYANFKTILSTEKMTYARTVVSIYLLLIRFVYNMLDIYHYVKEKLGQFTQQDISIFKFTSMCRNLSSAILDIRCLKELDPLIPQFYKHGIYEKRRKRKNMQQKHLFFKELNIIKN